MKIRERRGAQRVRDEKEQMKVQEGSDTEYYEQNRARSFCCPKHNKKNCKKIGILL